MATNEKVIELSNRVKSIKSSSNPETNHIIAGADDIFDDDKRKKQSLINQETDDTLANHSSAINGLNSQNYISVTATDQTTAVTDVLPDTGAVNTIYRVGKWDGTQFDETCYSEYAWNGTNYIHLSTKPRIGEVFDISVYKAIGGELATYANLDEALDEGNNVPVQLRSYGMRVQFIDRSTNEYAQYRLKSKTWSINTDDWAICDEGVYVDNPEFVYVKTDAKGKILWAIKIDGDIYYGVGCPQQVKDYIQERISALSLDEYEDIVTFLDGLEEGDTTLRTMLTNLNIAIGYEVTRATRAEGTKVDKVEGNSLINADYANTKNVIENPEYLKVTTDADDRIIEGIRTDGIKEINTPINANAGNINLNGMEIKVIDNPEFLSVELDNKGRILSATRKDGSHYIHNVESETLDAINADLKTKVNKVEGKQLSTNDYTNDEKEIVNTQYLTENPEYIKVETDTESRIFGGRKIDGKKFETVGFDTPNISVDGVTIENIQDPEDRLELKTDSEQRIISYRDHNGVLHEDAGIKLSKKAMSDFYNMLKSEGYTGNSNWSDAEIVELPIPKVCAIVNIGVSAQAELKTQDTKTYIEYWDKYGNYFRKPIVLNAQGSSSMSYKVKNQAFDLDDGSKIKFGNWVACDSFHLKKYFIDVFRGQCIVGYWLTEQVYNTRPFCQRRPWDYLNQLNDVDNSNGSFSKDFDTGALAHPDGFPVKIFFNGKNAGIYAFNLKKQRENYYCKKTNSKHIILDGILGGPFWMANGDLTVTGDVYSMVWEDFEVRNPKSLVYATAVNGSYKYDADIKETEIAGNNGMNTVYDNWSNEVTDYAVGKVVKYGSNYFLNTVVNNTNEPVTSSGGNKNTADSPDYKNKTGCGWINCTLSVNAKYYINRLTTAITAINAEETTEAKKAKMEEFFNIPFLIDYDLIGQVLHHYDGYRKNWIWVTNDGMLWSPTSYDMDSIFGQHYNGASYVTESLTSILGGSNTVPTYYLKKDKLYWTDVKARYAELRDKKIFDVDNIVGLLEKWVNSCGYDNLKEDIEEIVTSPYLVDGNVVVDANNNAVLVPNTPSYRDGSKIYSYPPETGGWYNSIQRVRNWLIMRISNLDTYYEYGD